MEKITSLTNAARKAFASLATSKGRKEYGLFMAQGTKCVLDTLDHFQLHCLLSDAEWAEKYAHIETLVVKKSDLERITTLNTPPSVIAIYEIPKECDMDVANVKKQLSLALDCVQDPGNLGTIIRVCDWMGIENIFASQTTADVWNPKVVQATMGAISRVKVHYVDLPDFLSSMQGAKVYGTFLNGDNIYESRLASTGVIVMGNEGRGIGAEVENYVTNRLYIPSFPPDRSTSESLNVAIATAITLSEFRRNG